MLARLPGVRGERLVKLEQMRRWKRINATQRKIQQVQEQEQEQEQEQVEGGKMCINTPWLP